MPPSEVYEQRDLPRLVDLADHLKAYHDWTDSDLAANDGRLRQEHASEHGTGECDHPAVDWSC